MFALDDFTPLVQAHQQRKIKKPLTRRTPADENAGARHPPLRTGRRLEFLHFASFARAALPPCLAERLCLSGPSVLNCCFFGEAAPRRLRRSLNLRTGFKADAGKAKPFRKAERRSRWPDKAQ